MVVLVNKLLNYEIMTREQYIQMRNAGNFNIVYNYYAEMFDKQKHKPFLNMQDLANFLITSGFNIDIIMNKCVKYYDEKFAINILSDKDGNIIKIS